jgi:hypothetical protein
MGYAMYCLKADVFIFWQDHETALQSIRNLFQPTPTGPPDKVAKTHAFAWVDTARVLDAATLHDALAAWRWMVLNEDQSGNITELDFTGEKLGHDEILFRSLAPYLRAGSQIQMAGEDGAIWRWFFDGRTVHRQDGQVLFPEMPRHPSRPEP